MTTLAHKRILLGVTGGIAAYKSAELVRRLREAGAEVQVVMTAAACEFVTPLTFQALSGRAVRTDLFDRDAEAAMSHIELARWADAVMIAPCSANTLAGLAQGAADNLLTTLCLATDAPLAVAPAMNRLMWAHEATQDHIERLKQRGVHVVGPGSGGQACGETGEGRMSEPPELVEALAGLFEHGALAGTAVLITAGPTREAIDPVRFMTNRSSGKMGFALARAAREAGAAVTLVSGPVNLATPDGVERIDVETALEMHEQTLLRAPRTDIVIGCAAVADYRMARPAEQKIKRRDPETHLTLVKNPDILAEVAALPAGRRPWVAGFAAETEALEAHAREKLKRKNLDLIAANTVGPSAGFDRDDNALEVFWRDGGRSLPQTSKDKLARQLIALIAERRGTPQPTTDNNEKTATEDPR